MTIVEPKLDARLASRADTILWAILDQSTDCVKLLGLDGSLEYMNANGRSAMEIEDFSVISGCALDSLWPDESAGRLRLAIERAGDGHKDRFEGYCPTAKGNDRWWDVAVSPVLHDGEVTHILCSSRDVTDSHLRAIEAERRAASDKAAEREKIIAAELAHKTRNIIAVTTALTRMTLRGDERLDEAARGLCGRFRNLGLAIDAISGNAAGDTLDEIVHAILGDGDGSCRITIGAVPDAKLSDSDLRTLALVLGELHSNALKYGALSHDDGALALVFDHAPGGIRMRWKESGADNLKAPERLGTGSDLISRMTMSQPQAGKFVWEPDGLFFEMVIAASPVRRG